MAWRKLAAAMDEVAGICGTPNATWPQRWAVARRHLGRGRHLADQLKQMDGKDPKQPQQPKDGARAPPPDPHHLFTQFCRLGGQGRWDQAKSLASAARAVGQRMDTDERHAARREWRQWLQGGPGTINTGQVHRHAFQFVRGTAGWRRSPNVHQALPDIPGEDDVEGARDDDDLTYDGRNLTDHTSAIWTPSGPHRRASVGTARSRIRPAGG